MGLRGVIRLPRRFRGLETRQLCGAFPSGRCGRCRRFPDRRFWTTQHKSEITIRRTPREVRDTIELFYLNPAVPRREGVPNP